MLNGAARTATAVAKKRHAAYCGSDQSMLDA
jgi:hypothetical protein